MLTGFLPHGGVGRYYLFLRSRYRQFLGIWRIAMKKKEAASLQGVERGTIPENQQMKEQQNRLNFKQTPCRIWPGRRNEDKLRPQPSTQINTSGIHRTTATPEPTTTTPQEEMTGTPQRNGNLLIC